MSGQILIATFPAQVTPCLPIFLHTYPTNFAAQTAIITLIFIVYDNFLYNIIFVIAAYLFQLTVGNFTESDVSTTY